MNADDPLDELAGSVSDGKPVDWDGVETQGAAQAGASVRAMRDLERIAEFNRVLQRTPPSVSGPAGSPPAGVDRDPGRWGNLTLLERIGLGATGEVWRAWDATLQREVALKFLQAGPSDSDAALRTSLLEEARALARVKHRGIVSVYGIAEHDGRAGMWMELLRGSTLAEEIERRGGLPPAEVIRVGLDLCSALEAVDRAGLVHRDLKPANVILESDGRTVLTDFGLGVRRSLAGDDTPRGLGTPIFMSPGLLAGEAPTSRSDLYALGVTLWWALAGRPPFDARTLPELKAQAKRGPATPLGVARPDAPSSLVSAIERAMGVRPEDRVTGATELAVLLAAASSERRERAGSKASATRILAAAAAVIVTVAAASWFLPRLRGEKQRASESTTSSKPEGQNGARPHGTSAGPASGASTNYTVRATFVGRNQGGYRRLAAGDRVAPGDRLSLEFHATRPLWVYVLNEDERGEAYLLYPQPLFDVQNPIGSESTVILPGPIGGRENAWTVTSRGGKEHFLVVASPEPVGEIEAELSRLPAATPGRPIQYAAIPASAMERLRGVGGLSPLPPGEGVPEHARTFQRFEALADREAVTQGVWVRTITLENPLR